MKVYVIKNKEGKYLSGHEWCEDLINADFYVKTNEFINKDETWQKIITIAEGDLEHQLAEKDKEIEEYQKYFNAFGCKDFIEFKGLIGLTKISKNDNDLIQQTRHQVCEIIRKECANTEDIELSSYISLCEILDQIEKGEIK